MRHPVGFSENKDLLDRLHVGSIGNNTGDVNGLITDRRGGMVRSFYRSMSADLESILARVERRLEKVGLSAAAASKLAGKADAIRNMQRAVAEGKSRQGVSTSTLNALAPVLKTTSTWLLAEAGPEEPGSLEDSGMFVVSERRRIDADLVSASYAGVVQAGHWREIDDTDNPKPPRAEAPDREYPTAKLFFFDVVGDSMNALKPIPILSGQQVVCLEYESLGNRVPWRDGMVVVVEQRQKGGLMRERSVKQIEVYRDRTEFCPRSTNPKHKPIIIPFEGEMEDGRTVEILGIVRRITSEVEI